MADLDNIFQQGAPCFCGHPASAHLSTGVPGKVGYCEDCGDPWKDHTPGIAHEYQPAPAANPEQKYPGSLSDWNSEEDAAYNLPPVPESGISAAEAAWMAQIEIGYDMRRRPDFFAGYYSRDAEVEAIRAAAREALAPTARIAQEARAEVEALRSQLSLADQLALACLEMARHEHQTDEARDARMLIVKLRTEYLAGRPALVEGRRRNEH